MIFYLRLTYFLELLVTCNFFLTLFLPWNSEMRSLADILLDLVAGVSIPINAFHLASPLWMLILLLPLMLITMMRSLQGMFDKYRVGLLKLNRRAAYLAIAAMTWLYYSNIELENANLQSGRLQYGFWLAGGSILLLTFLLIVETSLPGSPAAKPIECPRCGELNAAGNRRCFNCGIIFFPGG